MSATDTELHLLKHSEQRCTETLNSGNLMFFWRSALYERDC